MPPAAPPATGSRPADLGPDSERLPAGRLVPDRRDRQRQRQPVIPGSAAALRGAVAPGETMWHGARGGWWEQMAAVMVERDGVIAAVRGLAEDALAGRGGALFVAGEAGLGKTMVLEHAVAMARDRFRVGVGRADVA